MCGRSGSALREHGIAFAAGLSPLSEIENAERQLTDPLRPFMPSVSRAKHGHIYAKRLTIQPNPGAEFVPLIVDDPAIVNN